MAKQGQAPAQETAQAISVTMTQDKVTKNAVRFKEDHAQESEPDRIGQLYLQKHNFPNGAPKQIRVTVQAA